MSKNVQNGNLMGSLKKGVKMFFKGVYQDEIVTFYNYFLQHSRKNRLKNRLKKTFFGHFSYEHLIRLMRRFESALRNNFVNILLTKISNNILKSFNNLGAA